MFSHSDRYIFAVGLKFSLSKFKDLFVGQNLNSRQYCQIILYCVGMGSLSFHVILYRSKDIGKDQKVNEKNLRRVNKPPSFATVTVSKIINI